MSSRIASLVVLATASAGLAYAQPPTYDVAYLGKVPGAVALYPKGVNDHGVVVGDAGYGGVNFIPFVAAIGQAPTLLPLLPGHTKGYAEAINNAGVIVGACMVTSNPVAVIWTPGPSGYVVSQIPPLPTTGQFPSNAMALNELGDVVGFAVSSAGGGFVWNASTGTIDVVTLGLVGIVNDVNEQRQIIAFNKRLDLDTLVVAPAFAGPSYRSLQYLNDAGVATWWEHNPFGTAL